MASAAWCSWAAMAGSSRSWVARSARVARMSSLAWLVMAEASALCRQDAEVAAAGHRADARAREAEPFSGDGETVAELRYVLAVLGSGGRRGGMAAGMAASSRRASADGGWSRCAARTAAAVIHSPLIAWCRRRRAGAGMPERGGTVMVSWAAQGASVRACWASSLSRAAVTGPEVMAGAQRELPVRRPAGPVVKWVCSRSWAAARWSAAADRCRTTGWASSLMAVPCRRLRAARRSAIRASATASVWGSEGCCRAGSGCMGWGRSVKERASVETRRPSWATASRRASWGRSPRKATAALMCCPAGCRTSPKVAVTAGPGHQVADPPGSASGLGAGELIARFCRQGRGAGEAVI